MASLSATATNYGCFRAFARCLYSDHWLNLAESPNLDETDLHSRLKENWTMVGSVSGLVTGFTYVVANSDIEFSHGLLFDEYRHDLFAFVSMLSFSFALQATLFSAGLYGMLNVLGICNTKWFIQQNWFIIDIPLIFCATGIVLMLASALISTGGLVPAWAYFILLCIGSCGTIFFSVVFFRMQRMMYRKLENQKILSTNDVLAGINETNDDENEQESGSTNKQKTMEEMYEE